METRRNTTSEELAAALGHWARGDGPVYRQLAEAIKAAVVAGDLLPGRRLPAERRLAEELAVSRSTILAAFEVLKDEGWLVSRRGSGTWLGSPDHTALDTDQVSARSLRANAFLRPGGGDPVDLATAALGAAPVVGDVVASLDHEALAPVLDGHGYAPAGLAELRRRVAEGFTAAGAATGEEEVLVTTGTQQALTLVATLAVRPGDVALVEHPTSPGVLDALRAAGADLCSVPVGRHGLRIDVLEDLMTRRSPRLVVLVPTFHTPTGSVLPAGPRRRIAELAQRLQILVVEDLSHASIALSDEPPPPPIAAFGGDHVLSIGSMSKLFWGGLRVGWIRGPAHLVTRLSRLKATADLGTPLLSQLVAARLLPHASAVAAARRAQLVPRLDRLEQLLAGRLPDWRWRRPEGGLSLWVEMPEGNATTFAQAALRHGVIVAPGPLLSADEGHSRHLRLSFAPGVGVLAEGVDRLAAAWAETRESAPGDALTAGAVL